VIHFGGVAFRNDWKMPVPRYLRDTDREVRAAVREIEAPTTLLSFRGGVPSGGPSKKTAGVGLSQSVRIQDSGTNRGSAA